MTEKRKGESVCNGSSGFVVISDLVESGIPKVINISEEEEDDATSDEISKFDFIFYISST